MKTLLKYIKSNIKLIAGILVLGLFIGFLIGKLTIHHQIITSTNQQITTSANHQITTSANHQITKSSNQIWTCSMHPQIRMDHPGKCPICGMDLIPLQDLSMADTAVSANEIRMNEEAVKIADIQTMVVRKSYPDKEVYLLGKVRPDERNIAELTARFGGRIEKLFVNFTGQRVKKGERLASVYSPALITAQKELLEALGYKQTNPEFYRAARNKLKLWDLSEDQINSIEKEGHTLTYFDIQSPIEGTVTRRDVAPGDYIKEGSPLFEVIDLSKVWVMFEAYESDLPWISNGDRVDFTVASLPGKKFDGRISFIDPVIDPKTRIARVRVEVPNQGELLKPEMFANGIVISTIAGNRKDLVVPKTAVLWTGKRSIVYVKVPNRQQPTFEYRQITLGPEAGDFYVVAAGLKEGEEIAVNGVFSIDAAAQLAGKISMMNPEGGTGSAGSMPGMNMGTNQAKPADTSSTKVKTTEKKEIPEEFKNQLTDVYVTYLPMKNDFVSSDPGKVKEQAEKLKEQLGHVNMELLSGETHMEWMEYLKQLEGAVNKIVTASDIGIQREGFADFNLAFYKVMKRFGLSDSTVYYQYCPMAFNNKGAYWFSEKKDIENPYFGSKMLKCGETRETFDYK